MSTIRQGGAAPRKLQWAHAPFELIQTPKFTNSLANLPIDDYVETASIMAVVHNCIIRGLNTIYLQAPHVTPADHKDFIGYCLCWCEVLEDHHHGEEKYLFPGIEEAAGVSGLMDVNVEQHKQFQPGLEEFQAYLSSLVGKEDNFSGKKLCSLIDSFGSILWQHLADEIPTLLNLSTYSTKIPIAQLSEKDGKEAMVAMNKTKGLPFFFMNHDLTFENSLWKDWPGAPAAAKWTIRHVFTGWNSGYWKFAACDFDGSPKALYVGGTN